jgi:NAD(P)-dependent dehydrogenase (short-subunit alcohol dehydrogenase family)
MSEPWLAGQVAVVTGAGSGIGEATAVALARAGAAVVLAGRRVERLNEVGERIIMHGGRAVAVPCDVSRPEDVDALFEHAERLGPPAALVCAAGVLSKASFHEMSVEDWSATIGVNLTGAFLCARRAFGPMRRAGEGRIVLLSSLSGVYATEKFPGLTAYNASKSGLVGLAEGIAADGRDAGISVACLSPGAVDTEMLRTANPELKPGLVPEDVARLVVTVLNDLLPEASGANIPLFSNR